MEEKGSYTVEAAIVMSAILLIVFAIISAFLLLYQNVVMTYVATQAAQQGAVMWTDTSVQMDGTRQGKDQQKVYYRIGELLSGSSGKTQKVEEWAQAKLAQMIPRSLVGNGKDQVKVTFENSLFQRFVTVEIKKAVDIPFAGVMQFFSDDLDMSIKVRSAVSEPAEYIRTLDLAYLVALDLWDMIQGKLGPILAMFQ